MLVQTVTIIRLTNHSTEISQKMNMKFRFIMEVNITFIAFAKVRRKLVECIVVQ